MQPKILIIMTTPYSTSDSSRTLDAYFHYWEKKNVRQIFSRNWVPNKGHCEEMYQITDSELLKCWLHKKKTAGHIYQYEQMLDKSGNTVINEEATKGLYKLGEKHSPVIEILRKCLWRKKYWCTKQLIEWLDTYKPECIVYNFSNHLFTQQIALYVANRYNIPIVAIIGDDYYFNDEKKFSFNYYLFRKKFKKLTESILNKNASAIYCSDKIKEKYNAYFGINGQTVYFTSELQRREFRKINSVCPKVVYFGSIRLGRNNALCDIATALGEIDASYMLEVYTSEKDQTISGKLREHPNVLYGGNIPYSEVEKKISTADIYVIAEGFREEDINFTKYSLSTKAADGLASGVAILTYGPLESGVVEYMKSTKASQVCVNSSKLKENIEELIANVDLQKKYYDQAIKITEKNHTLKRSTSVFESVIESVIENGVK